MKAFIVIGAAAAGLALLPSFAIGKGCVEGAAVGGVAGHVAGHHGVVGAAVGCGVGHHSATKKGKEKEQAANASAQGTTTPNAPAAQPAPAKP
jgi:hypothetical protein